MDDMDNMDRMDEMDGMDTNLNPINRPSFNSLLCFKKRNLCCSPLFSVSSVVYNVVEW